MKKTVSTLAVLICIISVLASCGRNEQGELAELRSQISEMKNALTSTTETSHKTATSYTTTFNTVTPSTTKNQQKNTCIPKHTTTTSNLIIYTNSPTIKRTIAKGKTATTKNSPVLISDIVLNYEILPPDSIGSVYVNAKYTNNSKYAITKVNYKIWLKDIDKTVYLSSVDTVTPGETSPKFDTFGPKSLKSNDMEFLKCSFSVIDENGKKSYIDYDYKLKKYSVL